MRNISHLVRLSFPTRLLISAFLLSSISMILKPLPASAAVCREIKTVQESADPDRNTSKGGHLTQHIDGLAPPPKTSQKGKTLFESKGKFQAAWNGYKSISNPQQCSKSQAQQEVDVTKLKIKFLGASSCIEADANGRCTKKESYVATKVFFGFILYEGEWILNTAFPVPLK